MLAESPLVRTLSEKLSSLVAGASFAKVRGPPPAEPGWASLFEGVKARGQRTCWSVAGRPCCSQLPALPDAPLVPAHRIAAPQLVPQVNPTEATAAADSAAPAAAEPTGRALLERRLRLYCLTERVVKGDGACQFRSLSDQLYRWGTPAALVPSKPCTSHPPARTAVMMLRRNIPVWGRLSHAQPSPCWTPRPCLPCSTPRLHSFVRQVVCQQLKAHPEWYCDHVPGGTMPILALSIPGREATCCSFQLQTSGLAARRDQTCA